MKKYNSIISYNSKTKEVVAVWFIEGRKNCPSYEMGTGPGTELRFSTWKEGVFPSHDVTDEATDELKAQIFPK